jgi:hypothetical protein
MTTVPLPGSEPATRSPDGPVVAPGIALVDVLDRVLATGVVVTGDITLSIADVDLVRISLRALIASVGAIARAEGAPLNEEAQP